MTPTKLRQKSQRQRIFRADASFDHTLVFDRALVYAPERLRQLCCKDRCEWHTGIGVAYQNLSVRVLPFTPILIRDVVVRNSWHVLDVLVCGFFGGKISKTLGGS